MIYYILYLIHTHTHTDDIAWASLPVKAEVSKLKLNEMVFLEGFCKLVATKYSFIDFEDALINSVNPSYLI